MGFTQTHIQNQRHRHLIILLLFLLIPSSTHVTFMAEGRRASKHFHQIRGTGEVKTVVRIGSRPPRCDRRCNTCGHCEAVQVPAVPQAKNKHSFSAASMRGEDGGSNYKPMSWKCKCGDMIFNP